MGNTFSITMRRRKPIIHYKNIPNYPQRVHRPRTDVLVGWTKEENERFALFVKVAERECERRYAAYSERDYGAITMEQTILRHRLACIWYKDNQPTKPTNHETD